MKAMETPEEKRARRLAKKAAKVKVSYSFFLYTPWVFIHVLKGQEKIKRYSLVVECRKFLHF